jgi:hypothetical protein
LKVVPRLKKTGQIAIGAMVTVQAGSMTQQQPVIATNGYLVNNDPRPNFGLGKETLAKTVTVLWPDGKKQVWHNVKADQILEVTESE